MISCDGEYVKLEGRQTELLAEWTVITCGIASCLRDDLANDEANRVMIEMLFAAIGTVEKKA